MEIIRDLVFETSSINVQVFKKRENERFNRTPHPHIYDLRVTNNIYSIANSRSVEQIFCCQL